jgi:hypothetical protein
MRNTVTDTTKDVSPTGWLDKGTNDAWVNPEWHVGFRRSTERRGKDDEANMEFYVKNV